jgi:hypothetical protein
MSGTVLFLGAGATKSIQGPMTDEILPAMYAAQAAGLPTGDPLRPVGLAGFLEGTFNVRPSVPKEQYPSLPLLMSLIDTALDRREDLAGWDFARLLQLRAELELGIFEVLEGALRRFPTNNHYALLDRLFPVGVEPRVVTTNYDLVVDSALMYLSKVRQPPGGLPEYHCALANLGVVPSPLRYGTVLKLHGSVNWLFCRTCQRLELGATESTRFMEIFNRIASKDLRAAFTPDGAKCSVCDSQLLPLLVAPSHLKDYRNPHLSLVWYEAQRILRQATKIVFIGYSLPDDDVEVVYLLKRSLAHIKNPRDITVVELCRENPAIPSYDHQVGRRYRTLFGDVDWYAGGVDAWLAAKASGQFT